MIVVCKSVWEVLSVIVQSYCECAVITSIIITVGFPTPLRFELVHVSHVMLSGVFASTQHITSPARTREIRFGSIWSMSISYFMA